MILVIGDTHWDDQPQNEYRWKLFEIVRKICKQKKISQIIHLGDALDRKDRFSAIFVNRLVNELTQIAELAPIKILRGNHDSPLNGPAFFTFLNQLDHPVFYITEPTPDGDMILLPFTAEPLTDWREIKFSQYKAAFMHATVQGAVSENGQQLQAGKFPIFPRNLEIYSGDVHVQQKVRNITYVGCPYPIKFGDDFPCRLVLLDENTLEIVEEIPLDIQQKAVVEVSSLAEMRKLALQPGSQIRVKFNLASDQVQNWGSIEAEVASWAGKAGVSVSSIEAIIEQSSSSLTDLDVAPETILRQFAENEKIDKSLLDIGFELLKGA